jgi:protoheme IX farnesyltransferase
VLVAAGLAPFGIGMAGATYGVAAALLGAEFLRRAWLVWRMDGAGPAPARGLFAYSILYLFGLFGSLLGETLLASGN